MSWSQFSINSFSKKSFGVFLGLSLLIHLLHIGSLYLVPPHWLDQWTPLESQDVVIDLIEQESKNPSRQIVRQVPPPTSISEENDIPARFLSEKRQRVLLETRAQNSGLTQNREARPKFLENAKEKSQSEGPQNENIKVEKSQQGWDLKDFRPLALPSNMKRDLDPFGSSTVGEHLPQDVSVGSFTALNTDRFTFYSFYARVEELVRFRWEKRVKDAISSYEPQYVRGVLQKKNWITQVRFVLKPNGEFHQAIVLKESGVKSFDLSPIWAFKEARIFPNPPPEMVGEDGFINLDFSFNVHFSPNAWAEAR